MNVRVLLSQSEKIELNGHPMPINTGNVFGRNWNLFWRQKDKKHLFSDFTIFRFLYDTAGTLLKETKLSF